MSELERVFLETIAREELFPRGASLCAAVSGGADSLAMLYLLHRFAPRRSWKLRVLHVNHNARPEASEEARFVGETAESLSLPFTEETLPGELQGSAEGYWSSARQAIYMEQDCLVAVAHNASDRAETILLRLVEGAGLRGLGGMDYRGRGPVRRPMLDLSGASIRKWLTARGISWIEDSSNTDTRMARNRLRQQVIPVLEEAFPEALKGICRSGVTLSRWRDLQDSLTDYLPGETATRKELLKLPGILVLLSLWNMAGRPRGGFRELEKTARWLSRGTDGEHILPGGSRLKVRGDSITVEERGTERF